MKLFHKTNNEPQPFEPTPSDRTDRILATLEHADLDPEQTLLVGSAALALYGATFYSARGVDAARPGDVDFLSTTTQAEALFQSGSHNGAPITLKENFNDRAQSVLRIGTGPLPIDVISAPLRTLELNRYDARLLKRIAAGRPIIGGSGYRIIPLPDILQAQKDNILRYDEKARYDLRSTREALARLRKE